MGCDRTPILDVAADEVEISPVSEQQRALYFQVTVHKESLLVGPVVEGEALSDVGCELELGVHRLVGVAGDKVIHLHLCDIVNV